jgi:hypothetical protein
MRRFRLVLDTVLSAIATADRDLLNAGRQVFREKQIRELGGVLLSFATVVRMMDTPSVMGFLRRCVG